MTREIVISKTAKKKLDQLFKHLVENWSVKVKNEFIDKLDYNLEIIKTQPEIFPESKKGKRLYRCVITKQTTLYYRFDTKQINIVTIFDTRQDPSKLKKDI